MSIHTEITTRTLQGPEQVAVFLYIGIYYLGICENNLSQIRNKRPSP